jgi:exosortase A-associated hydrolase 1
MTDFHESAELFDCDGCQLLGILHHSTSPSEIGAVLLVGGPQYRVGAHRMYTDIARRLAGCGVPTLRFDFRGMGDSEGEFPGFQNLDADISAAVSALIERSPGVRRVALLGLCDGATAAAMYECDKDLVACKILLNPWVHTEAGEAKAYLSYYYPRRILQRAFWRSLVRGEIRIFTRLREFVDQFIRSFSGRGADGADADVDFRVRMLSSLQAFRGNVLLALSEHDMTAVEFREYTSSSQAWTRLLQRADVRSIELEGADHTLSEHAHLEEFVTQVSRTILDGR